MRRAILMLAVLLVVGACADDDAGSSSTTSATTPSATTTTELEAAETTTTTPVTSTMVAIVHSPTVDTQGQPEMPPVLGSSGDPNGSGCVVPPGDTLPDGIWFGYARSYVGGVIALDLACYFTGAAASAAMVEDSIDDEFGEGWYIRNFVDKNYDVPVVDGATVFFLDVGNPAGLFPEPLPFGDWPSPSSFLCSEPFGNCLLWLYINGGSATAIVEQFAP